MPRRKRRAEGTAEGAGVEKPVGDTAAERYDEAITAIEGPVIKLFAQGLRTKRVVNVLIVSVAFDIIVTIAISFFGFKIYDVADTANDAVRRNAELGIERTRDACEQRNEFKRLDLERWMKVLAINDRPEPGETKAQRRDRIATGKEYKAFIQKADMPEDCDALVQARIEELKHLSAEEPLGGRYVR